MAPRGRTARWSRSLPSRRPKKAQRDEARERGAVPILTAEKTEIDAMVAAVRAHPFAGRLFEEGTGTAEASLFWTDDEAGVWRRSRLEHLLK